MATRRIKDITNTATTFASDDFIALDGSTQGTRKMDKDDLISEISAGVSGDYLEEANNLSDVASLDTSKLNMEIPDVGTAPNEVPLNGMLGDMAYQSSDGVSVANLEITDKIDLSGAPTQQLEVYGDAPTVRVTDTSDGVGDGDSIGKLEFYGNDGSSGGVGVRAKIDTVSESAAGNQYGVAISTSTANSAPVERVRVDGSGRVGIGTSSPNTLLECYDTVKPVIRLSGSGNDADGTNYGSIEFYNRDASIDGPNVGAQIHVESSSVNGAGGELVFSTERSSSEGEGSAPLERVRIDDSGNVTINNGNLVLSSGAIDFGATNTTTGVTVSSSVLDHYEAGLWTPVVADAVSGGNTATVGTAQGRYTRVGRIVQFSCLVANINTTGLTAGLGLYIQGLPFPGVAVSSWKPMTVLMDNITFSGQVVGILGQNESAIRFKQFASGGADSDLTVSAVVNSTADIHVQGVYEVV